MARDPKDESLRRHREWLGYLQPVGLVVSPPALVEADAHVNRDIIAEHQRFLAFVQEKLVLGHAEPVPAVADLPGLLREVFGWQPSDLIPAGDPRTAALEVVLPDYHETLRPSYAVPEDKPGADVPGWLMLIQELPAGTPLDAAAPGDARRWQASPHARFERLLRGVQVPIGLLSNGTDLRLVYAPAGETAGHVTFPVRAMAEVAGRPVFAALHMLLSAERLFSLPDRQRLPAILAASRRYQNTVSTELAEQVLAALFELLRGFQAADAQRQGALLRDVLARDPDQVYAGLLTVLLRLVFLLYAEDRGLMSEDEVYVRYYSVTGLYERLREDDGRYPDTMDQRYGAWAQLLTLFRLVHDGGRHGGLHLPARHGYLFFPDKYPFLEGRAFESQRQPGERINPPLVSDGVVFRVLRNLMVLEGERISYRSLDVEQIGSVYEAIMGFRLERATGPSIPVKPKKRHGAPVTVNLDALLAVPPEKRGKWLKEQTDQEVTGKALNDLKAAATPEAVVAALDRKVARDLTPNIVPAGSMVLQPSDERRRSGSHYTPRALTLPIVRKALEPVLKRLGESPTPAQILDLKVCDLAMGSGAFLVEACRQLGEALLAAWNAHGGMPAVPPDETPELFAQRTIAQRCLYGVDKNPLAVDLAKLSLWLATLAKDHPFTFLDHALRCGDSLVGLTFDQIRKFHWKPAEKEQMLRGQEYLRSRIETATSKRCQIIEWGDYASPLEKEGNLKNADSALSLVRFAGNLAVAAFFAEKNEKKRLLTRTDWLTMLSEFLLTGNMGVRPTKEEQRLREGPHPIEPFHWDIEFPEVFQGTDGGFDVIVGNPPFAGKNTIIEGHRSGYLDWLKAIHPESHGNSDLVAHFFRRAFNLLRPGGTFGLIATNTIAQGDTRSTGLRWICTHGGTIYAARRRYKWPGQAAVVVSVVHGAKGTMSGPFDLDGRPAERITAYLFHAGGHDDPAKLKQNENRSFIGHFISGPGFTFDDTDRSGATTSVAEIERLITTDPKNQSRIFPYIGGEEVLNHPQHQPHRFVINFEDFSEDQARQWPDLMAIIEEKVRPERTSLPPTNSWNRTIAAKWWLFGAYRKELSDAVSRMERVMFHPNLSANLAFVFLPSSIIVGAPHNVIAFDGWAPFCVLQCRIHEAWARFFASSMKDDLRYTPSDCFETFPFPEGFESDSALEKAGKTYYEFRAELMVRNNEGLTKTYNRFHDPDERSPDILKLRELHAAMDRAVLDAYGWTELRPTCDFFLDYEDEEDDEEPTARRRKKPWRYRWPDDFRDEVLARLLDLNKQRAEQEKLAGLAAGSKGKRKAKRPRPDATDKENPRLFG